MIVIKKNNNPEITSPVIETELSTPQTPIHNLHFNKWTRSLKVVMPVVTHDLNHLVYFWKEVKVVWPNHVRYVYFCCNVDLFNTMGFNTFGTDSPLRPVSSGYDCSLQCRHQYATQWLEVLPNNKHTLG